MMFYLFTFSGILNWNKKTIFQLRDTKFHIESYIDMLVVNIMDVLMLTYLWVRLKSPVTIEYVSSGS